MAEFSQKYGSETRVDLSQRTGLPTLVYNFSTPKLVKDDVEAAKQFISDSRNFFLNGEDVDNLRFHARREGEKAVHIDFQQYYNDVPVWNAVLSVHMVGENIMMVNGAYIPDIQLDTSPNISAEESVEVAKLDLGPDSSLSLNNTHPELVISADGERPMLCWRFTIHSVSPTATWEYLIDATSSAVISKNDLNKSVTGSGFVFNDNPVVTPNLIVGALFNLKEGGQLRGNFADVSSFQGFDGTNAVIGAHEAFSPSYTFNFLPGQRPFSEQTVYYQIDRAHTFFNSFGVSVLNTPFSTIVHYRELDQTNLVSEAAAFDTDCRCMHVGDGSGRFRTGADDPSFDAEVIFHEYTHAVIFSKNEKLSSTRDSYGQALEEGYADYFAASFFNNPLIGQWTTRPAPQELRRLNNANHYPEHVIDPLKGRREPHYTGLIWSGGLWDIRGALGSAIADKVIYASLGYLVQGPNETFETALAALLSGDFEVRGSQDAALLRQKMNARGIFEPGMSLAGITQFVNLTAEDSNLTGTIKAAAPGRCELGRTQYSIDVSPGTSSLSVDVSGNGNVNLYVRYGSPIDIQNDQIVANYRAETLGSSEHITASLGTSPPLATGMYYVGVNNCSASPVTYTLHVQYTRVDGTNGTDDIRIASGVPVSNIAPGNFGENHSVGVLANTQYFLDVPANARLLNVTLVGATPGADIDLFVNSGRRVSIDSNLAPLADKSSTTLTNIESLELDSSTAQPFFPGTRYYIAVANYSRIPTSFQLQATVLTTSLFPSESPLQRGVLKTGTLGGAPGIITVSPTNYVVDVPSGATQLRVEVLSNSGTDVDLYVRQGSRVFAGGGGVVRDVASHLLGPSQSIIIDRTSIPPLDNSTYYIAVGNRAPTPITFTLLVTVMQGGGTQIDTQAFHSNVLNNVVDLARAGGIVVDGDQFFVDVPATVSELKVRLDAPDGNDLVLLGKSGPQRIPPTTSDGNDFFDENHTFLGVEFFNYVNGTGTITLARSAVRPYPALKTGRYYFAVANKSGNVVNYHLTFSMSPAPAPAVVQFSASAYAVAEGGGSARVTVTRGGNTLSPVTVSYATGGGTASSRADYTPTRGIINFAAGETSKTFNVLITDDTLAEGSETVGLNLSDPTGGAILGAPVAATLTLTDNDAVNGATNPLDGAQFFARQHYSDFFNRVPDAAGLQFWTNEIAQCGSNVQCVEVRRINVSAAFFLSIEYQQTGYLVYRLYKASFNRMPQLEEFQPDTQTIGNGVVVGTPNWEQLLENNKRAFFGAWVNRDSFRNAYDQLTDIGYVDTLIANTGVAFSPVQRSALIIGLSAGTETRASVLRKVVEDQSFINKETNPAFVLTQYFGYLRRNPNDAPDRDFSGFNFWLGKLNQFNGNFVQAEMVKAFINSTEYRQRFAQR